jgi:hypothetical protein
MRKVGDQRCKGSGAPETDQAVHERQLPNVLAKCGGDIGEAEQERAEDEGADDAVAVHQSADGNGAGGKPQHANGIGERGVGPGNPEIGRNDRQLHHERPHADAAERAEQHGNEQPKPGIGGLHPAIRRA